MNKDSSGFPSDPKPHLGRRAIVLHSVQDAEYLVNNVRYKGALLFSTHSSVDVYLGEKYGISIRSLGEILSDAEIRQIKREVSESVDRVLPILERELPTQCDLGLKSDMRISDPLYSYHGRHHLLGLAVFQKAIEKIREVHSIDRFVVFQNTFQDFFRTDATVRDYLCGVLRHEELEVVSYGKPSSPLLYIKQRLRQTLKRLRDYARNRVYSLRYSQKTIYFYSPSGRLARILRTYLGGHRLVDLLVLSSPSAKSDPKIPRAEPLAERSPQRPLDDILLSDLRADFHAKRGWYLRVLKTLEALHIPDAPALGIWDGPPICGAPALAFEYLKSKSVHVIGMQHGGVYGTAHYPWLYHADFTRCTTFLTNGANRQDLIKVLPGQQLSCDIVGKMLPREIRAPRCQKQVDILFPLTNSQSMFNGGINRIQPHQLTERQSRLLAYLDRLEGLEIVVKPFQGSTPENCAVLPLLEKCRNLKVVADCSLQRFLEDHLPRATIIEYNSSPLYDVLPLDTEIFFMPDQVLPMEEGAFRLLSKRVHSSEDISELIQKIDQFLAGKLPRKRDDSFFDHFERKEISEEQFARFIEDSLYPGRKPKVSEKVA